MPRAREDRTRNASEPSWRVPDRQDGRTTPGPVDLVICVGLVMAAAVAAYALPPGDWLRFALTIPMLFFVPGYLLLQAAIRTSTRTERVRHGLLAVGFSPAIVGALALLTALVPGAFRSDVIIGVVSLGALVFAAAAWYRRSGSALATREPAAAPQAVPEEGE